MPLTVNTGGATLPMGPDANTSITVTVGGLPCPLIGTPSANQLVCSSPAFNPGMVYAEYFSFLFGTPNQALSLDAYAPSESVVRCT